MRTCTKCGMKKSLSEFRRDKTKRDGIYPSCSSCGKKVQKAYYQAHKETCCKANRAYYIANRKVELVKRRVYYRTHKQRMLAISREWAMKNKERVRIIKQRWDKANKDAVNNKSHRRRARLLGAASQDFSVRGWKLLRNVFRSKCVYCGKSSKLEQDHVKPLSKGGIHSVSNIVTACRQCNASKSDGPAPHFWWKTASA